MLNILEIKVGSGQLCPYIVKTAGRGPRLPEGFRSIIDILKLKVFLRLKTAFLLCNKLQNNLDISHAHEFR